MGVSAAAASAVRDGDIGVGDIRCLLPERRVPVEELPELPRLDATSRKFVRDCGVTTVAAYEDGEAPGSLAARAVREVSRCTGPAPDLLLLVAPRAPDVLLGSDATRVQAEGGVEGAFAFSVDGLGCTGSSAAWAIARDLMAADASRECAVVAYASRPLALDRVRYPVTIVGDGAFAMTLVRGGRPALRAHRMQTDGAFHDLFYVDYKPVPWYEWREECASPDRYVFELAMQSRLRLAALVDAVLADAGVTKADVAATLMQNVTMHAFEFYESALGLPIHDVCRANLVRYGHLGAMDVVLNLQELLAGGELRSGDHVLVLNNSPVAAWAVTLWQA